MAKKYKAVKISRGSTGWGGPLVIEPTEQRSKVVSVTGGGIHPIARQIAEMTGAEVYVVHTSCKPAVEAIVDALDRFIGTQGNANVAVKRGHRIHHAQRV